MPVPDKDPRVPALLAPATLFIYYQVNPAHSDSLAASTRQMQAALEQAHPGLEARLWARPEAQPPGTSTWMETYRHPQGVNPVLASRIEQAAQGVSEGRLGPRHVEVFTPIA